MDKKDGIEIIYYNIFIFIFFVIFPWNILMCLFVEKEDKEEKNNKMEFDENLTKINSLVKNKIQYYDNNHEIKIKANSRLYGIVPDLDCLKEIAIYMLKDHDNNKKFFSTDEKKQIEELSEYFKGFK